MSTRSDYDVIVIGGGASGLMTAGRAGERGLRVLLVEKNKEFGKKLSITGGGRCNIFNAEDDVRALLENYGEAEKFLHTPFSQHGMRDSWQFFENRGVPIVVEARKRAFPKSQKATDVTRCLRQYVIESNVVCQTKTTVSGFVFEKGKIMGIQTSAGVYTARAYVLATGGSSHQETGSTGEGVEWLQSLGHTVHAPSPTIVPLVVRDIWVRAVSGTSLSFMKITFGADRTKAEGKFSRTGKVLFTHFGISGPLVLNASQMVQQLLERGSVEARIDMYPDTDISTLRNRVLEVFNKNKNKELKNVLKECVPAGMANAVACIFSQELLTMKVHSVSKEDRHKLVDHLKAMPLTIVGTMGMDWAVISDGGVDLREVDMKTMRSKLHDNLYFTGDVLHINRPSGGYSLQLCWTTGSVAGSSV